jgi:hypothetical protein
MGTSFTGFTASSSPLLAFPLPFSYKATKLIYFYDSFTISVADPEPDPYVFRPPGSGSGSISIRYGSESGSGIRILL